MRPLCAYTIISAHVRFSYVSVSTLFCSRPVKQRISNAMQRSISADFGLASSQHR
jgi:hypothetical protein